MGNGGFDVGLPDKPDGFKGTEGFEGDTGLLWNALKVGVMGVLEGRSMGRTKFRKEANGVVSLVGELLEPVALTPVGTEGSEKVGSSSSSSIDGNC